MEKDNAVQNQKVFVSLERVMLLVDHYHMACEKVEYFKNVSADGTNPNAIRWKEAKVTLEKVFATLSLPVTLR